MERKYLSAGITSAISVLLTLTTFFSPAFGQSVPPPKDVPEMTLKVAEYAPAGGVWGEVSDWYDAEIKRITNGKVKIVHYYGGSLFKAPDIMGAVANGATNIGVIQSIYTAERIPLTHVSMIVSVLATGGNLKAAQAANWEYCQLPAVQDELRAHNLVVLRTPGLSTHQFWTKKPINTLADLKGMRIRSFGAHMEVMSSVGAVPISMPFAEIYEALHKGILDGLHAAIDSVKRYRLKEVTNYLTYADLGCALGYVICMNVNDWKKFPPKVQEAIKNLGPVADDRYADALVTGEQKELEEMKKAGLKISSLTKEERLLFEAPAKVGWYKYAKEMDAKGIRGTWAVETFLQLLKKHQGQ